MNRILTDISSKLNTQYTLTHNLVTILKEAAGLGFIVFIILYLFEDTEPDITPDSFIGILQYLGFGLVTFLITFLTFFMLPKIHPKKINDETWTLKKEIIAIFFLLVLIAFGNFVLKYLYGFSELDFHSLFVTTEQTLKIGLFPVVIALFVDQNRQLKRNLRTATEINSNLSPVMENHNDNVKYILKDENNRNSIEVDVNDLYFVKSAGNYVEIYTYQNNSIKSILLRNSLKNVESQFQESDKVFRCHRTFIVNIIKISSVEGNTLGYKLRLKDCDYEIPVSRSYTKELKNKINQLYLH